jgi:hypothetical protein
MSLKSSVFLALIVFIVGCGSANVAKDQDTSSGDRKLGVKVEVSKTTVAPGETIRLVATVERIRAESISFNWINVTKWGEILGNPESNSIQWKAPDSIPPGSFKVEVIQLVVTAITHVISSTEKGVEVNTEVLTETKTIPITISGSGG